ncbi:MAG: hypothetical protein Q3974_04660 [Rothia sp. (in: high G+C Gram-positive bacteria)]|nr:hypothetical protein [Rothia sp. (in: high G+C Gram-positive bacteria)]
MSSISRRSLVKGTAWSAPVLFASTSIPAYAASQCSPTVRFSGGIYYNWGQLGATSTNQQLTVGGQTYVDNLPAGITVTSITYQFWIQNRIGQTSPGPGAYYVKNSTSDRASQNVSAMPWSPTAGSGFNPRVSSTVNLTDYLYRDGSTLPSWDLNMSWSSSINTLNSYSTGNSGCQNFTTGPSGRFAINYSGVVGVPAGDSRQTIKSEVLVKVTLSDGQVLSYRTNTVNV